MPRHESSTQHTLGPGIGSGSTFSFPLTVVIPADGEMVAGEFAARETHPALWGDWRKCYESPCSPLEYLVFHSVEGGRQSDGTFLYTIRAENQHDDRTRDVRLTIWWDGPSPASALTDEQISVKKLFDTAAERNEGEAIQEPPAKV